MLKYILLIPTNLQDWSRLILSMFVKIDPLRDQKNMFHLHKELDQHSFTEAEEQ